ncbi:nucleoside-diphosphate sugar epimerase [Clostridium folliculivorans]|nr:nucleoside-diphosphate sugar epimerase [Clostridium folliculivorans]
MKYLKHHRGPLLALIDIMLINFSYIIALYFRFSFSIPKEYWSNYKLSIGFIIFIYMISLFAFGIYKSLWTYAGTDEFLLAVASCFAAGTVSIIFTKTVNLSLPFSVEILSSILATMLVCGFRIMFRIYRRILIIVGKIERNNMKRVMIVGAGSAGAMIIREMKSHNEMNYEPIVIVDDSSFKIGTSISGIKILGNRNSIERFVVEKEIDVILIAIPSLDRENKKQIIDICKKTGAKIKIVPGVYELIGETYLLNKIRDVDVEDLLGRDPIKLDMDGISDYLEDKVVLVTGGGGSIGSELCRQIVRFNPKQLLILDIYENNAYDLQNELKFKYPDLNLEVIIASVRDKRRLENIFKEFRPEVIFHAAAHKHVPLMEHNPSEAVKNNVFGTLNLAECANKFNVKRFVMISTDKAVNPTNIMGATKRMCEMIIQAMDKISETEFVAVRFGNVLGSNGSVIPLFKKQIAQGGPITLTHKDITRFFMTIPEASQLVLQAGAYANGGEIFVLDMGKPVKIYDLAVDLIKLSGLEPNVDIEIKVTGLRPGEKLYEELLMDEEGLDNTSHEKIFVGRPMADNIEELKRKLSELRFILEKEGKEEIFYKVMEIVPTYVKPVLSEVSASSEK